MWAQLGGTRSLPSRLSLVVMITWIHKVIMKTVIHAVHVLHLQATHKELFHPNCACLLRSLSSGYLSVRNASTHYKLDTCFVTITQYLTFSIYVSHMHGRFDTLYISIGYFPVRNILWYNHLVESTILYGVIKTSSMSTITCRVGWTQLHVLSKIVSFWFGGWWIDGIIIEWCSVPYFNPFLKNVNI